MEKSSFTADTDGNQTDRDKLENRPQIPNASSANTSIGGDRQSSKSQALSSTTSNSSKTKPDPSPVSPRSHRLTLKEELGCQYNSPSMVSVANSDSTSQRVNVASRQMLHQTPSVEFTRPVDPELLRATVLDTKSDLNDASIKSTQPSQRPSKQGHYADDE